MFISDGSAVKKENKTLSFFPCLSLTIRIFQAVAAVDLLHISGTWKFAWVPVDTRLVEVCMSWDGQVLRWWETTVASGGLFPESRPPACQRAKRRRRFVSWRRGPGGRSCPNTGPNGRKLRPLPSLLSRRSDRVPHPAPLCQPARSKNRAWWRRKRAELPIRSRPGRRRPPTASWNRPYRKYRRPKEPWVFSSFRSLKRVNSQCDFALFPQYFRQRKPCRWPLGL